MATAYFEKGLLINYHESDCNLPNGTYVRFAPDPEVFKNGPIGYSYDRVCSDIHDISYLYPGITFVVTNADTNTSKTYCAKNGIVDFVKDNLSSPLHPHIMTAEITKLHFSGAVNMKSHMCSLMDCVAPKAAVPSQEQKVLLRAHLIH